TLGSLPHGVVAWIGAKLAETDDVTEVLQEALCRGRDVKIALSGRMDARDASRHQVALDIAGLPVGPHEARGLHGYRGAKERHAEVLSAAGLGSLEERCRDAHSGDGRGIVVDGRAEHELRPVRRRALRCGDPGHALEHLIEAGLVPQWAAVAVPGDRAVD